MTDTFDEKIVKMQATLAQKKAELEAMDACSKTSWKTNGVFTLDGKTVTLMTATEATALEVATRVLWDSKYRQEAAAMLGIVDAAKVQGYAAQDWLDDCKKRVSVLQVKERKAQVDAMQKKLDQLLSPEKRRQMDVLAIEEQMGKMGF